MYKDERAVDRLWFKLNAKNTKLLQIKFNLAFRCHFIRRLVRIPPVSIPPLGTPLVRIPPPPQHWPIHQMCRTLRSRGHAGNPCCSGSPSKRRICSCCSRANICSDLNGWPRTLGRSLRQTRWWSLLEAGEAASDQDLPTTCVVLRILSTRAVSDNGMEHQDPE